MTTPNHAALSGFLERLLLRSRLSDEEQAAILGLNGQEKQVPARRDLILPGRDVHFVSLVAEGLVGRFDQMADGRRQITAFHIAGDMCDLHSVVAPVTGWGITALSTAVVLQIAHADLRVIAARYPNLVMAFWRDTTVDASILAKWVANVGRKDSRARVAHLLCEMAMRMERANLGTRHRYRLPVSQEQIGDAMGITSVHVSRTLQTLRAEGNLSMHRHVVEIHDWDRLTDLADFVPTFMLFDDQAAPEFPAA